MRGSGSVRTQMTPRDQGVINRLDPSILSSNGVVEIRSTRRPHRKPPPKWVLDDEQIRVLLLRVFPKLQTNTRQRIRASRWAAIIRMYYSSGMTESDIAQEIGGSADTIRATRRSILRAAEGRAARNGLPLKKKIVPPCPCLIEAGKAQDAGTSTPA